MMPMHKRLAELSVGSPDWTMPPGMPVRPSWVDQVIDMAKMCAPRVTTDRIPSTELTGCTCQSVYENQNGEPQAAVQHLPGGEETSMHKTLMALTDLPELHYRLLLWLWAGHRSDRDLDAVVRLLRPVVSRAVAKAKHRHRRGFIMNNYIALALMEVGAIGDDRYAGKSACLVCGGTGQVYDLEQKKNVACESCEGQGVLPWSQARRAMLTGMARQSWQQTHEAPYSVVLREVRALDAEGRSMLYQAIRDL